MVITGIIILAFLVGIGASILALVSEEGRGASITTAAGAFLVGIGLFLFSSLVVVGTKEFGVVTTYGKPTGVLSNGLHFKAPWQNVTQMDAAIQTDSYAKGNNPSCITVRIAHQATACVDASIRWRIKEDASMSLFQNYRDFNNVRDSLVTRDLNAALNKELENYDVLKVDSNGDSTAPQLSDIATSVTADMQSQIGNQIEVLNVIIPVMHFDADTQTRLNNLQGQIAQTRIAQQAEQTALAQAKANAALAKSVSSDPNVLVSKCLDLISEAITKGYQIPAGFTCWPGGSSVGVIAGTTKG